MTSWPAKTRSNALLIAAATAITAVGLVINPAPAHAACDQYSFNGPFSFRQADGWRVETSLLGESTSYEPAVAIDVNGDRVNGNMRPGGITGRKVHFEDFFGYGNLGIYDGNVYDDGFVRGVARVVNQYGVHGVSWDSETTLVCNSDP
jgi:hypothetical protein